MTQSRDLNKNNIMNVLKKSILLRYLNINNKKELKKITYKNKEYDNDIVISEEKISVDISSIENAKKIFLELGFCNLVNVFYDVIVYEKDGMELAFQNVEGLGLLLEYESFLDYFNYSIEKIKLEKENMLKEIKKLNINICSDYDIKKAYELILKKL